MTEVLQLQQRLKQTFLSSLMSLEKSGRPINFELVLISGHNAVMTMLQDATFNPRWLKLDQQKVESHPVEFALTLG